MWRLSLRPFEEIEIWIYFERERMGEFEVNDEDSVCDDEARPDILCGGDLDLYCLRCK